MAEERIIRGRRVRKNNDGTFSDLGPVGGSQGGTPQPLIPARVDPYKAPEYDLKVKGDARDDIKTDIAVRGESRDIAKTGFDQATTMRKEYDSSPVVKAYRDSIPLVVDVLSSPDSAYSDTKLIYAYVKLLDPIGAVREGDVAMAQSGGSYAENQFANIKKQFGIEGGGQLSPSQRQQIKLMMNNKLAEYGAAYNQERARFSEMASRVGADPFMVVGPHAGDAFRERYKPLRDQLNEREKRGFQEAPEGGLQDLVGGGGGSGPTQFYDQYGNPIQETNGAMLYDKDGNFRGESIMGDIGGGSGQGRASSPYVTGNDNAGRQVLGGVGDIVHGVGDTLGIVGNPLSATVNALAGGKVLPTDMGQAMVESFGLPQSAPDSMTGAINRAASSGLSLSGAARGAERLINPSAMKAALGTLGATPGRDMIAAGVGGGSAELARQSGAGPIGQIGAGLLGGGLAYGGASAMMPRNRVVSPQASTLQQSGEAIGVPVNRAMADPDAGNLIARTDASQFGGPMLQRGLSDKAEELRRSVVNNLGRDGEVLDPISQGDMVKDAAGRWIDRTRDIASRRYGRVDRLSAGVPAQPTGTIASLDATLSELGKSPSLNQGELGFLSGLKSDLQGGLDVPALRDMRSTLGKKVTNGNLVLGPDDARLLAIKEAITQDIGSSLSAAGRPQVAKMLQNADKAYSARQDYIGKVIQPVIGKRTQNASSETIARRVQGMAATKDARGYSRLSKAMNEMERANIAATRARELGIGRNGDFSAANLATQLDPRNLSPVGARAVFGQDAAKMPDYQAVARSLRDAQSAMNSRKSSTAVALGGLAGQIGGPVIGAIPGLATGSAGTTAGGIMLGAAIPAAKAIRDVAAAKSLLSGNIGKVTAKDVEKKVRGGIMGKAIVPAQIPSLMDRAAVDAYLRDLARQSPGRAVAEDEANGRRKPPKKR